MARSTLLAAALGAALLAGCAATGGTSDTDESELVQSVRQELALDPLLNTAQLTVEESGGTIVIGGFVDSLQELDQIRGVIEGVDGVASVENRAIVQP